ncbi:MAG: hypothetical protein AB1728_02315 [Bacteroidota bacterium]
MNTKIILTASAIVLGSAALALLFASEEILNSMNIASGRSLQLLLQIIGALYFAFAMMNWMTRESAIGGIYNRPIVVANTSHFSIAGLALLKGAVSMPDASLSTWIIAGLYAGFAVAFAMILFRHPGENK